MCTQSSKVYVNAQVHSTDMAKEKGKLEMWLHELNEKCTIKQKEIMYTEKRGNVYKKGN